VGTRQRQAPVSEYRNSHSNSNKKIKTVGADLLIRARQIQNMLLNCHSYYSLRYGTFSIDRLLETASAMGHKKMVLTDINNTSAAWNFVRLASKYNIEPILGIDFRDGVKQQFVAIAKNLDGFKEMNTFLSSLLINKQKIPTEAPEFKNAYVVYPFHKKQPRSLRENEFIGLKPDQISLFPLSVWKNQQHKLVVMSTATFATKKDFNTHRLLRAIGLNVLLSKLPKEEEASETDLLLDRNTILEKYENYPEIIKNTERLLNNCKIEFTFGINNNKKAFGESEAKDFKHLKKLTYDGLKYRYETITDEILDRVAKELKIIKQKQFTSYFLINWDIIKYAQKKGFFHVGRGSGANSVVAYCLQITNVDPIDLDLYFERFINLYRENPPDFDLDFSWKDRDEITKYIFDKYGHQHTALIATFNTFKYRAMIRELGKVFGLPKEDMDRLSREKRTYNSLDTIEKLVIKYSHYIQGFPNYLSIHAGGVLISEKPITTYTTVHLPPKGFPTTMFDMIVAEDIGLYKFDILSQRGLGHIKDAVMAVKKNCNIDLDIHDIKKFKKDPKIKELLKTGRTMGCFYVESPAMRMLLRKLKCEDYLSLVAASSIIRPGVAQSGMMREYILRFRNPERRKKAHPIMLEIMPETFGVMVYQEDVIKVAHYFAGLTLAEADVLRRGMSGKYRSREEFQKVKGKFFENCTEKGHEEKLSREIWFQIESFAGYSFSKGHSASYAVESFQSLYLKAYYPREFMVGVINNFGGFYRTETYVHEAKMSGATIEAPCINQSEYLTSILDKTIFLGLIHINELEKKSIHRIFTSRQEDGDFKDINDFVKRTALSLDQCIILCKVGAFRFTGKSKKEVMWNLHFLLGGHKKKKIDRYELFEIPNKDYTLPPLFTKPLEDAFDEIELINFPLSNPFDLLKKDFSHIIKAEEFHKHNGEIITICGYQVQVKRVTTSKGNQMFFACFRDYYGHFFDTTHFPNIARAFPFRGKGIYKLIARVVEEFDFYSLEVIQMEKLHTVEDPRYG